MADAEAPSAVHSEQHSEQQHEAQLHSEQLHSEQASLEEDEAQQQQVEEEQAGEISESEKDTDTFEDATDDTNAEDTSTAEPNPEQLEHSTDMKAERQATHEENGQGQEQEHAQEEAAAKRESVLSSKASADEGPVVADHVHADHDHEAVPEHEMTRNGDGEHAIAHESVTVDTNTIGGGHDSAHESVTVDSSNAAEGNVSAHEHNTAHEDAIVDEHIVVEEPTVEEPTVEEPTVQEPTVEEPTVQEPTPVEPTIVAAAAAVADAYVVTEEPQEVEGVDQDVSTHKPHISTTSMDNISLGDEQTPTQARPGGTFDSNPPLPPAVESIKGLSGDHRVSFPPPPPPPGSTKPSPPRARTDSDGPIKGLSGDLPAVNYPPPPPPSETKPTPLPPPPPTRKVSSPFAWFSRATSKKPSSPTRKPAPDHSRSNTASSLATLGSASETVLDDASGKPRRNSLKDRFQMLRQQGEMAAADDKKEGQGQGQGQERGRSGSMHGLLGGDIKETLSAPVVALARSASFSGAAASPVKLPPGTAAGVSLPVEDTTAVNWDLWQSVVYEGPAAVHRTSGEELNRAIANGIPQPIRGVVWQVLADSKNAHLEVMYKELVARGTDKEIRPSTMVRSQSTFANGAVEKEATVSSASSIKSDSSPPGTAVSSPGPSHEQNGGDYVTQDKKRSSLDDKAAIQKLEKAIKRDLGARTSYSKYIASAGLQDGLFGLCKAYALFDEPVGYAQGMNFIAMPLLFNMPEEEAFTLFVRLMSKYNLRSMFTHDMHGLHLHLYQFERLLEDYEPALYCHLHRRGVSPTLYATQWFLTLFAYRFPLQLVLRVYDLVLSEGLSAILKFGIVLMQKNAKVLLDIKDMSQLSTHLKEKLFDVYIDKSPSATSILESGFFGSAGGIDKEVYRADELVRDACALKISSATLATYAADFEEEQRTEKDRETELENLRSNNASLTARVRRLEERAQQHDTEHVGIASELVRTKVENENLLDENEILKTSVEELKKMVDMQPAEVEERLRAEMDRIMQRNIEVQNENRALEETVQDTEHELVGTKLMFAQLNAEHDSLKQKLAQIQTMLNENK